MNVTELIAILSDDSVKATLDRMVLTNEETPLRFMAAVSIDANGKPRCFQAGDASVIEMSGLLHTFATGIEVEGLTMGSEDGEDDDDAE